LKTKRKTNFQQKLEKASAEKQQKSVSPIPISIPISIPIAKQISLAGKLIINALFTGCRLHLSDN